MGGCPVYYRVFSSISGFYSLDASRAFSPIVRTKNVFVHCHFSPGPEGWEQICPQLRTSALYQYSFCPGSIYFHSVVVCHLSCMREDNVFNNPGWKEMVIGVSLFCNAHFNNSHITLETQG